MKRLSSVFVLDWIALRPHCSGLTNRRLWFWSAIAGQAEKLDALRTHTRGLIWGLFPAAEEVKG